MSGKHLTAEEEYFAKEELSKIKKLAIEQKAKLEIEEHEKLKQLHFMHCPKCGFNLKPVEFRGVTIDKCFHCEGVFLDNGELEKLAGHESGFIPSVLSLFKAK
ncbi:MAG: zf-TFIIB domain-containing protein [Deltaproteobacteria bacterium]|nr:zf-TFIIB domain-containing protein [Deltaproteobacteria bacterium]